MAGGTYRDPASAVYPEIARVAPEPARMADITISESEHGPPGARRYDYIQTYFLQGLTSLHLEFTPAS